jgi:MFS family permease
VQPARFELVINLKTAKAPGSSCEAVYCTFSLQTLLGVIGRHAGSVPGFSYSQAMKNSNIVWDAKSLDAFIMAPQKALPGTTMSFPGIPDQGETKSLAATILVYAVFTGAAAFSTNVWMLAVFRFLAGIGVGGEWAMAGTYVAEAWPEDRRKMGAGYLQTGYYFGFFVAAALNYTIGASLGWRAMFLCGLFPVVVSIATLLGVKEPLACCVPHKRPIRRKLICAWRGPGSSTSTPSSTRRIGRS